MKRDNDTAAGPFPHDGSCTLRWTDGSLWVPKLEGTGLFGRVTRADRRLYTMRMVSQLRALERAVNHHRGELGVHHWPFAEALDPPLYL